MKPAGYILPPGIKLQSTEIRRYGASTLEVPELTATTLSDLMNRLIEGQKSFLAGQTTDRLLQISDEAVIRWLKKDNPQRRQAEEALPEITGFSKPMVKVGLTRLLEGLRADRLRAVLKEELGDPRFLDEFLPRLSGRSKAFGPRLMTQILSGNIPGLSAGGLIYGLLVKSSVLAKVSSQEPVFTNLFARTLLDVEPGLAECLAVVGWKGGNREAEALEDLVLRRSELVVVTGSNEAIAAIKSRLLNSEGTRLATYGHRISLGLIGREALADLPAIADPAALDVALYDQQGCLSPHLFYVESGGIHTPREFARALGDSLSRLERRLPRGTVSTRTAAALHHFRSLYEMRQADGQPIAIYGSETGNLWTVVYENDPSFLPSPLHRTVRVKPIDDLSRVPPLLSDWRAYLQTAGVAVRPDRLEGLANELSAAGVNRICPIGRMQDPATGWHADGRPAIAEWVRWVDLESESK
jgi:hypothetical protein